VEEKEEPRFRDETAADQSQLKTLGQWAARYVKERGLGAIIKANVHHPWSSKKKTRIKPEKKNR